MKRFFFLYFDKFLTLKYSLKIKLFRSSLGELTSILYLIQHINAKNLFFFRKKRVLRSKKTIEFRKRGFTTFSNKSIEKSSLVMLEKIRSIKDQWGIHNDINFNFNPTLNFQNELIQIFESGIDEFIKSVYKSDYSIFYHKIYKSKRDSTEQIPEHSQLWHADGYPGTGINLMICHTPISKNNGSMKIINWEKSRELLNKLFFDYKQFLRYKNYLDPINKENKVEYRKVRCQLLKDYIDQESINYFQPESEKSGTIFAFSNNCVHAGGYTEVGYERIVSLFNIYPSTKSSTLEEKLDFCSKNDYSFPKINEIFKT
tara:strand:+ start:1105 stop:2049 length:945 start_codon:yes stop_codon:yes gene_type:complete